MLKSQSLRARLFILFLISFFDAKSQVSNASSSLEVAQKNAIKSYSGSFGLKSYSLYNGSEYLMYTPLNGEHPYFSMIWEEGTLKYDDQLYTDMYLLYDISTDQVITKYFTGEDFQLIKSFVSFFTLEDHKFVNLNDSSVRPGFYEILFDSKIKIYSKHEKSLHESIVDHQVRLDFTEKTHFLLYKDGNFIHVNNKKSLLQAFANHVHELKHFIRNKKLKFRPSAFENSLVQAVAFCEQLP